MKKYLILTIALISVLTLTMDVYGGMGGAGAGAPAGAGTGRGQGMGQRGGMRGGMLNVEAVNAAIALIEEQVAALKEAMEGAEPMTFGRGQGGGMGRGAAAGAEGGQVDMQTMMTDLQERQAKVQAAANSISEQLIVLDRAPIQAEITELQAAATQATAEEAEETAALIQAMITARQEKAQALGVTLRGGRGGRGGRGNRGQGGAGAGAPAGAGTGRGGGAATTQ